MASRVRPDRLERITNLVLVLLDTRRPLTLAEIGGTVGGYPPEPVALRQAFERDKRSLRENNIPVSLFRLEGTGGEVGYRILPEDYYLPELDLTEPEERALGLALTAVRIIGSGPADGVGALWSAPGPGVPPIAMLPSLPALGELHRAAQTGALATFGYHGRRRELEPHGLVFHEGAWYVVGRDRTAGDAPGGEVRTFRVDRIEGPVGVGEAGAFDPPAEADLLGEGPPRPVARRARSTATASPSWSSPAGRRTAPSPSSARPPSRGGRRTGRYGSVARSATRTGSSTSCSASASRPRWSALPSCGRSSPPGCGRSLRPAPGRRPRRRLPVPVPAVPVGGPPAGHRAARSRRSATARLDGRRRGPGERCRRWRRLRQRRRQRLRRPRVRAAAARQSATVSAGCWRCSHSSTGRGRRGSTSWRSVSG